MKSKSKNRILGAKPDMVVAFSAIFITGLLLAELLPTGIYPALLVAALCSLFLSFPEALGKFRLLFLALAALSSAAFYGNLRAEPQADYSHFLKLDGTTGTVSGQFKGEFKLSRSGSIRFRMSGTTYSVDEQNVSVPGDLDCSLKKPEFMPEPEQSYSLTGTFATGQSGQPPVFYATSMENVTGNISLYGVAGRLQRKLRDGLRSVLPKRHAAIAIGFILGDTSLIGPEDRALFKETGISHLLAVSGQHIMVVIVFLAAFLQWFKVPPVSRSIMIAVFLVLYGITTTGSPSVWRALIMYFCVAIVLHIEAFPSPVRPLAIAGLLLLFYKPALVFNAAFQLSFTAVLSIIFLREPIEQVLMRFYFPPLLARYLGITFAANLGTLPMTALLFGTVSTSALLVNPLIIWSFSYILPVAFLTAFFSTFWPAASVIIATGLSLVLDGMLIFLAKAQAVPGQFFYVGNIPGFVVAAIYGFMLLLVAMQNKRQLQKLSESSQTASGNSQKGETLSVNAAVKPADAKTISASVPGAVAEKNLRRPETKTPQPFRHAPTLIAMDELLCECGRRPLKNFKQSGETMIPLQLLSIDSQNLYHQMIDLDRKTFIAEPERLLQSHIFLMALTGNEILNRISAHLDPPPAPGEIRIGQPVKDRYLATAVLAELLLHSSILTRARSDDFMMIISRGQSVYNRARKQLERILEHLNFEESIEQHFALRRDMLGWCTEFIKFDNNSSQLEITRLRPEQ